jgi:uncharacterized protein (TIGR02594 family)
MASYKVKAFSLHVRKTPRVADNVVGFLHQGDVVQGLTISADRQFHQVRHGELVGWVSNKWLVRIAPKAQRYEVISVGLNVRDKPNIHGRKVGALSQHDIVTSDGSSANGHWIHVKKGGLVGYASARYLRSVRRASPGGGSGSGTGHAHPAGPVPKWYTIARRELDAGVARVSGSGDSPRVVRYLKSTNLGKPANKNDETPWCSAFVNWCVEQSGEDGTNSALARNWLHWGRKLKSPTRGCIVVLWRGSKKGSEGHVGFYVRKIDNGSFKMLSGNTSDQVTVSNFSTSKVLGYRKL